VAGVNEQTHHGLSVVGFVLDVGKNEEAFFGNKRNAAEPDQQQDRERAGKKFHGNWKRQDDTIP
jgi:hypothetical protein